MRLEPATLALFIYTLHCPDGSYSRSLPSTSSFDKLRTSGFEIHAWDDGPVSPCLISPQALGTPCYPA